MDPQKSSGILVLASACDDAGKTTGLFIVSAPNKEVEDPFLLTPLPSPMEEKRVGAPVIGHEQHTKPQSKTSKGILKLPKEINPAELESIPPPIQRSARLSPRALIRLTPLPYTGKKGSHRVPKIHFSEDIQWLDTWPVSEYNRAACEFAAKALTPALAMAIKKELNEVKAEMDVHEDSRANTQYYRV